MAPSRDSRLCVCVTKRACGRNNRSEKLRVFFRESPTRKEAKNFSFSCAKKKKRNESVCVCVCVRANCQKREFFFFVSLLFLLLAHHKVGEEEELRAESSSVQVPFRVARSASGHISWQRQVPVGGAAIRTRKGPGGRFLPGCELFSGVERLRRGLFRNLVTSGGATGHHFRQEFADLLDTKTISGKLRSVFCVLS